MLKFIYTLHYDINGIGAILGDENNTLKGFEFAMGVFKVADKYDIKRLIEPTLGDIQRNLDTISNRRTLISILSALCATSPGCEHRFAKLIIKTIFLAHYDLISSKEFAGLCLKHPTFAADVMTSFARIKCTMCNKTLVVSTSHQTPGSNYSHPCPYCKYSITVTAI